MVMTDVYPHTLGVDTSKEIGSQIKSGYFTPIIHRNRFANGCGKGATSLILATFTARHVSVGVLLFLTIHSLTPQILAKSLFYRPDHSNRFSQISLNSIVIGSPLWICSANTPEAASFSFSKSNVSLIR